MSIEVNNLSKHYGAQKAVNQVSFSVKKGEIVGFLGPNGAGKSTTMKMITGYLQADGGSARVSGLDVITDPIAIKKKIGYLPEANPLYHDMYVREYLDFIAGIHQLKNRKEAIEKVIVLTGLTVESKKKVGQLSKGYKQRVGLAAALIHEPEVLILDEPTSGLDPNQIIINKGSIVADDTLANLQKGKTGTHIVSVQFNEPVNRKLIEQITGVIGLQQPQAATFKLQTLNPESVRKQLLQISIDHNLNIVSLQTEGHSLEEVFRTLTTAS